MPRVFAESNQARKRCDERTRAADIHTEEQLTVIFRKLREQDRRGYVTDELTGKGAEDERILLQKDLKHRANQGDARHIARKDEKGAESEQKRIVHLFQRITVHKEEDDRHDHKTDLIRNDAENDDDGKREKHEIHDRAQARNLRFFFTDLKRFFLHENEAARRDDCNGNGKRQSHDAHKFARGDIESGINIEILRVSEGGEHTAEVGGDILHNESKRHVFFLTRGGKHEISEGQKREQRHIVGKEHRADKGDIHKCQHTEAGIFTNADDLMRQRHEKADISKRTDARQGTEKASERLKIEIAEILDIRRNDKRRDERRQNGNAKDSILFHEAFYHFEYMMKSKRGNLSFYRYRFHSPKTPSKIIS